MFFTTKQDIDKANQLLLEQPDMYASMIVWEGKGKASKAGGDITMTPDVSPGWVTNAYASAVGQNVVCINDYGNCYEGRITANDADSVTFAAAGGIDVDNDAAGDPGDWTDDEYYDMYIMIPHESYSWGDYFGVVKEPALMVEEERAELEDPVEGLIAEGLIRVNMDITGVNYNVVNGDVLKAIRNVKEIGSQTTVAQLYGGFRPDVRKKFRVVYAGRTHEGKDFLMRYFMGKFRAEGELAPNGTEFTSLSWGFRPYADPIRRKDRNAYKIQIQK